MTPAVLQAVDELKATFPGSTVTLRDTGDGGASVTIDAIDPGTPYSQRATWIGFVIGFQYPYSDIYPLFVRPDLARVDGAALGEGFSPSAFDGTPATQISRRSNKLNPATDTAALKVTKVMAWMRAR